MSRDSATPFPNRIIKLPRIQVQPEEHLLFAAERSTTCIIDMPADKPRISFQKKRLISSNYSGLLFGRVPILRLKDPRGRPPGTEVTQLRDSQEPRKPTLRSGCWAMQKQLTLWQRKQIRRKYLGSPIETRKWPRNGSGMEMNGLDRPVQSYV